MEGDDEEASAQRPDQPVAPTEPLSQPELPPQFQPPLPGWSPEPPTAPAGYAPPGSYPPSESYPPPPPGGAPRFESRPATNPSDGGAWGAAPGLPPGVLAPPPASHQSSTPASDGTLIEPRPRPRIPGVLAATGGLLVVSSLLIFIGELPDKHPRIPGLLLSLVFLAIGVVGLFIWRDRPTVAVGVAVSALAVVPVLVFTFVDPNRPNIAFGSLSRGKDTLSGILVLSAVAWLVGYFASPGRRSAFYLGASLVAVWLLLLVQIATSALERYTGEANNFNPIGPGFDPGLTGRRQAGRFSSAASSTSTRAGMVSLVVGLVYLIAAWRLDRRGGTRAATPFFATAALVLTIAVLTLVEPWKTEGAAIVAVVLGLTGIWLGTKAGRRFTAWYGGFAVFTGLVALLAKLSHNNNKVAGLLVLLAGLGLAFLANWLTDRPELGDGGSTLPSGDPGGGGSTAWSAPPAAGPGAAAYAPSPAGQPPPPQPAPWPSPPSTSAWAPPQPPPPQPPPSQ